MRESSPGEHSRTYRSALLKSESRRRSPGCLRCVARDCIYLSHAVRRGIRAPVPVSRVPNELRLEMPFPLRLGLRLHRNFHSAMHHKGEFDSVGNKGLQNDKRSRRDLQMTGHTLLRSCKSVPRMVCSRLSSIMFTSLSCYQGHAHGRLTARDVRTHDV